MELTVDSNPGLDAQNLPPILPVQLLPIEPKHGIGEVERTTKGNGTSRPTIFTYMGIRSGPDDAHNAAEIWHIKFACF